MKEGTPVIRKSDLKKQRAIYGTIDAMLPNNRVRVAWEHTRGGLVRISNGRANKTEVNASTLAEVTTEMRLAIVLATKARIVEYNRRRNAERPYICEKDGRLLPSQVKDGHCYYCGALITLEAQKEVKE